MRTKYFLSHQEGVNMGIKERTFIKAVIKPERAVDALSEAYHATKALIENQPTREYAKETITRVAKRKVGAIKNSLKNF